MSNLKVLIVGGTFSTERNEKPNAGYSTLHDYICFWAKNG